ncbi:MAG: AAA family ATPase [Bryobacteraceae bacterium]|nr:AAA family ATPase [Bryobacteraceae bacterium]
MRIAIDGAQSTGKTTLHQTLKQCLSGLLSFIPEASRVLASSFGIRAAEDWPTLLSDHKRLSEFFDAEERWLIEVEDANCRFIVDSSLMLIAAYRSYFDCSAGCDLLRERSYDLILYCPVSSDAINDGFRFNHGRTEVDELYRSVVRTHHQGMFVELPFDHNRARVAERAVLDCATNLQRRFS